MVMGPDGPSKLGTGDLSGGKRVAVFGLPGSYTPVCSAQHLPGYVAKTETLKAKGIDAIACISVNDPFVRKAWGDAHEVGDTVQMVAAPKGSFTQASGLTTDLSDLGLGERSERHSMIDDHGSVTAVNVERSVLDHDVSSADTLLSRARSAQPAARFSDSRLSRRAAASVTGSWQVLPIQM